MVAVVRLDEQVRSVSHVLKIISLAFLYLRHPVIVSYAPACVHCPRDRAHFTLMAFVFNSFTGRGRKLRAPQTRATHVPSPSRPPAGYYDPSIDAQVSAGARGLQDLRIDIDTGKRRGAEDRDTALGGLTQTRDRTLADLLTGETRLNEDYTRSTGELGRQFGILAQQQAQGARSRGVLSSGLAARAAQIRAGNQGRQQVGLDLARNRGLEDIGTRRTRVGEDFTTQSGLLERDFGRQFGAGGDLDLQLARGEREQPFLEADANALRLAQATAAGYVAPLPYWKFDKKPRRPRAPKGGGSGVG